MRWGEYHKTWRSLIRLNVAPGYIVQTNVEKIDKILRKASDEAMKKIVLFSALLMGALAGTGGCDDPTNPAPWPAMPEGGTFRGTAYQFGSGEISTSTQAVDLEAALTGATQAEADTAIGADADAGGTE